MELSFVEAMELVEIVSRVRFYIDSKLTHVLMMMVMTAGGLGLMLKAYVEDRSRKSKEKESG